MSNNGTVKKPTKAVFAKLCESKGGNKSEIARTLKCNRRSIDNWIEKDHAFREIYNDQREALIDLCETQMQILITGIPIIAEDEEGNKKRVGWTNEPNVAALIFTLKTRGKDRGYIERSEVTGKDGKPLVPSAPLPVVVMTPEKYKELIKAEEEAV